MTNFGPTRAELLFRFRISLLGVLLIVGAIGWRGVPADSQALGFFALAIVFLLISAGISRRGLNLMEDD